jgi:glycosyltransferase involved in cell wall biosynthesis
MSPMGQNVLIRAKAADIFPLTVWLGIYNGQQYLESLLGQLTNQSDQEFNLLVVDNCSTDDSLNCVLRWGKFFAGRITVCKNYQNYGGQGSCIASLNEINSPWFTAIHQDDLYLPNHIFELNKAIRKSNSNTVSISTSMGSMSSHGQIIVAPPRANWFLKQYDQTHNFLQNVRLHSIPTPSVAYRTDQFAKVASSWHTTFADALVVLKLSTMGEFKQVMKETMHYRENENSESHSINEVERRISTASGLTRAFASEEFATLISKIPILERHEFVRTLNDAISTRLGKCDIAEFVRLIANETIMMHWDYVEKSSVAEVHKSYQKMNGQFTTNLLSGFLDEWIQPTRETLNETNPFTALAETSQRALEINNSLVSSVHTNRFFSAIFLHIPFWMRYRVLKRLVTLLFRRNNRSWDFRRKY